MTSPITYRWIVRALQKVAVDRTMLPDAWVDKYRAGTSRKVIAQREAGIAPVPKDLFGGAPRSLYGVAPSNANAARPGMPTPAKDILDFGDANLNKYMNGNGEPTVEGLDEGAAGAPTRLPPVATSTIPPLSNVNRGGIG